MAGLSSVMGDPYCDAVARRAQAIARLQLAPFAAVVPPSAAFSCRVFTRHGPLGRRSDSPFCSLAMVHRGCSEERPELSAAHHLATVMVAKVDALAAVVSPSAAFSCRVFTRQGALVLLQICRD
jgi:hypothetical protein